MGATDAPLKTIVLYISSGAAMKLDQIAPKFHSNNIVKYPNFETGKHQTMRYSYINLGRGF